MKKKFLISALVAATLATSGCHYPNEEKQQKAFNNLLRTTETVCAEQKCPNKELHKVQVAQAVNMKSGLLDSFNDKINAGHAKMVELHTK